MSIGVGTAAKGGSEMGFWPVAVYTLVYSNFDILDFVLIAILGFGGASTYLILRTIRQATHNGKSRSGTRNRRSRRDASSSRWESWKALRGAYRSILPDSDRKAIIVGLAFLGNMFAGLILLLIMGYDIWVSPNPQTSLVGLFVLPILYFMVLGTAKIW